MEFNNEEEKKDGSFTYVKLSKESKDFILTDKKLEKYLVFKHRMIPKNQEEYMDIIVMELREIVEKLKEESD